MIPISSKKCVVALQVGWWDAAEQEWCTEGISDVKYDAETHALSFDTCKLMSLGLIISRIKLLPYGQWIFRPTSDTTGVLSITPENNPLPEPISFAISDGGCRLLTPKLPALQVRTLKCAAFSPLFKRSKFFFAGIPQGRLVPNLKSGSFVNTTFNSQICSSLLSHVQMVRYVRAFKGTVELCSALALLSANQPVHFQDGFDTYEFGWMVGAGAN